MMPVMLGYKLVPVSSMVKTIKQQRSYPNKKNRGIFRKYWDIIEVVPDPDFIIDERTKTIYAHPFTIGYLKSMLGSETQNGLFMQMGV